MAENALQVQIAAAEQRLAQVPAIAQKYGTAIKWGVGGAACIVAAPFVLAGIGGLIGGTILVAGMYVVTQAAPVFARRVQNTKQEMLMAEANLHLAALKAEARKNPIETLQNVYREKETALSATSDKIHKFATKVNNYGLNLKNFKRDFPEDAPMFDQEYAAWQQLLAQRKAKWEEARLGLEKFAKEITRANAIWEMTQATAELRQAAGDLEETFLQRIRKETALDAVQQSLAASMADLDQMMMVEIPIGARQQAALQNNPSLTMDVQPRIVNTVSVEATSRRDGFSK
jgi:hypothetical protein